MRPPLYNEPVATDGPLRGVLFDLDDTLFDHVHGARAALAGVHRMHACFAARPFAEFEHAHARCLEELHARVVRGEMGIDAARLARFRRLFVESGVEPTDAELAATAMAYRDTYMSARRPIEGALDLLAVLKTRVKIGIVSNNLLKEQQDKVRLCGFEDHVDALVVSEEVGVAKPDPEIFRVALARLRCEASEVVMIGDSWANDIEGAHAAGIRAIWLNRTGRRMPESARRVGEVTALAPIEPVIAAIFGDPQPGQPQLAVSGNGHG
jgi:HAD superfamily hydrolase (TIGR01549 family)